LIGIGEKFPSMPLVALLDPVTIAQAADGSFPWLGGIQLDTEFGGDWVAAAASLGSVILGPWHGNGTSSNTVGYEPFTTKDVVDRAHAAGMRVFPWTADDESTISKLIDDGVDGIISNYPERVMWVGKQRGMSVGRGRVPSKPECLAGAAF
jgi:glycerophosphoryl diester phosphodiesterase